MKAYRLKVFCFELFPALLQIKIGRAGSAVTLCLPKPYRHNSALDGGFSML